MTATKPINSSPMMCFVSARRALESCCQAGIRNRRKKVSPLSVVPPNPAVQRDIRDRIEQAFTHLPAKLQVVARLAVIEEQPYEDIAGALGISVGAVKSRVFRAVRLLRRKLKRMGVEP